MIKLKKQIQSKQSGMTAIMLAMFLAIVISLLTVGFATLVRKDQAETLDKTLSFQAQYAAESGVNKAISFINDNPLADGDGNCADITLGGNTFKSGFDVGQANVTCATWDRGTGTIEVSPSTTVAEMASFAGAKKIEVSWASSGNYGTGSIDTLPNGGLANDKRILAITVTNKSNLRERQRFYLVPWGSNGGAQDYDDSGVIGIVPKIFVAKVDSGEAKVQIGGFDEDKEYLLNAQFLNGDNSVNNVTIKNAPSSGFVNTSQYKIDVNARSQDITKRVIVYYSKTGTPGEPYVINIQNDGIVCKDFIVDGTQNPYNKASDSSTPGCPNI